MKSLTSKLIKLQELKIYINKVGVFGMWWEGNVGKGMWGGCYNSIQTDFEDLFRVQL